MPFYDVPAVYKRVLDQSQFSRPTGTTFCAVVGAFPKGPLIPVLINSVQQLYTTFGNNNPTIGFAGYCAVAALGGDDLSAGLDNPRGTNALWVRRAVHSDALFSLLAFDASSATGVSVINVTNVGSGYVDVPTVGFSGGGGTGAAAHAVLTPTSVASVGSIVGGSSYTSTPAVVLVPVDGNGSGATATATVVGNAVTAIDLTSAGSGYTAPPTVQIIGGGGSSASAVAVLTATTVASVVVDAAGSNYTSAPTVAFTPVGPGSGAAATAVLQQGGAFVADSPGVADPTARAFNAGESFTVYPLGPGALTNGTMAIDVVNVHPDVAYATWAGSHSYAVDDVVYHSPGGYYICLLAHTSGTFSVDLSTNKWVLYTDLSWDLRVFADSDFVNPVEIYRCSKSTKQDGFGRQLYLQDAVNPYSNYIHVLDNALVTTGPQTAGSLSKFANGVDGSALTDADINAGWADFQDVDKYPVRVLINAGYSTAAVQQYMVSLAAARSDCVAYLDTPAADQAASAAVDYRNNTLNLNSSFGSLFTPDYYTFDRHRGVYLYVPPSGAAARNRAYSDRQFGIWYADAGVDRGQIPDAFKVRVVYQPGDKALLYTNQINYIVKDGAYGIYVDGNRTTQVVASALQLRHVRFLVNLLLNEGAKVLKPLIYEPNNVFTWKRARDILTTLYLPVKRGGGLYDFFIQCDAATTPPDAIDRGEMYVNAFIKPVRDVEFIVYTIIVNRTSVILPTQQ